MVEKQEISSNLVNKALIGEVPVKLGHGFWFYFVLTFWGYFCLVCFIFFLAIQQGYSEVTLDEFSKLTKLEVPEQRAREIISLLSVEQSNMLFQSLSQFGKAANLVVELEVDFFFKYTCYEEGLNEDINLENLKVNLKKIYADLYALKWERAEFYGNLENILWQVAQGVAYLGWWITLVVIYALYKE